MEQNKATGSRFEILVIDFCETLVDLQTADHFVSYTIRHQGFIRRSIFNTFKSRYCFKIISFFGRAFGNSISYKEYLTFFLAGIKASELRRLGVNYCNESLLPLANWSVIEFIKRVANANKYQKIVICSGGYGVYMHEFCKRVGFNFITGVLASELAVVRSGNSLRGGIALDCMGGNKVSLINSVFPFEHNLTTITDSLADWPLMKVSSTVYFVESRKVSVRLLIDTSEISPDLS